MVSATTKIKEDNELYYEYMEKELVLEELMLSGE